MKPLTIEQVRNFEADAWVWIVSGDNGCYAQIQYRDANGLNVQRGKFSYWINNSDYGTKWLAWKNREQAEAKGEIMELPCLRQVNERLYELLFIDEYNHVTYKFYNVNQLKEAERRLAELTKE